MGQTATSMNVEPAGVACPVTCQTCRSQCGNHNVTGTALDNGDIGNPMCVITGTYEPTDEPTFEPTFEPTYEPTYEPTVEPTFEPTYETDEPTYETVQPTYEPTFEP